MTHLFDNSQAPESQAEDIFGQAGDWFASQGIGTYFWIACALIVPSFLPKGLRLPVFVACLSFGIIPGQMAFLLLLVLVSVVFLKYGLRQVPEGSVGLVLRLGKYQRTLASGISFIIPGLEVIARPPGLKTYHRNNEHSLVSDEGYVSLREEILDPITQKMICADNTVVEVDSIVYFRIVNAELSAFKVKNLGDSLLQLTETILRQEVGRLDGDSVVRSRDVLGAKIQEALAIAAEPWGTRIVRVEIQEIEFLDKVQESLTKAREEELKGRATVIAAERERDALVAKAEGEAKAVELAALAEFEKQKLEAEGMFLLESRRREGEAAGLRAITEALREAPDAMVALEALKAQESVAAGLGASNGLLIIPNETAGLVGALGAISKAVSTLSSSGADEIPSNDGPQRVS